jgi:hypothetical protein
MDNIWLGLFAVDVGYIGQGWTMSDWEFLFVIALEKIWNHLI